MCCVLFWFPFLFSRSARSFLSSSFACLLLCNASSVLCAVVRGRLHHPAGRMAHTLNGAMNEWITRIILSQPSQAIIFCSGDKNLFSPSAVRFHIFAINMHITHHTPAARSSSTSVGHNWASFSQKKRKSVRMNPQSSPSLVLAIFCHIKISWCECWDLVAMESVGLCYLCGNRKSRQPAQQKNDGVRRISQHYSRSKCEFMKCIWIVVGVAGACRRWNVNNLFELHSFRHLQPLFSRTRFFPACFCFGPYHFVVQWVHESLWVEPTAQVWYWWVCMLLSTIHMVTDVPFMHKNGVSWAPAFAPAFARPLFSFARCFSVLFSARKCSFQFNLPRHSHAIK